MTTLREAAQQALEALEQARDTTYSDTLYAKFEVAITALRAALEQPEQEPVAWMGTSGVGETIVCKKRIFSFMSTPLYTHPKRRSWQGLTQGEHEKARHVCRHVGVEGLVLWLEDKLKERNA